MGGFHIRDSSRWTGHGTLLHLSEHRPPLLSTLYEPPPKHLISVLAGCTPTPYQSGESTREQGITKAGNRHVRWMTTELAWSWLRFQPESALSVWLRERFGSGGKRLRRMGIVAVARKLLIALWRFLETGVVPEGAVLKANSANTWFTSMHH